MENITLNLCWLVFRNFHFSFPLNSMLTKFLMMTHANSITHTHTQTTHTNINELKNYYFIKKSSDIRHKGHHNTYSSCFFIIIFYILFVLSMLCSVHNSKFALLLANIISKKEKNLYHVKCTRTYIYIASPPISACTQHIFII